MARLPQLSDTEATGMTAELFTVIRGKIGMVPNIYRVAANRPAVLDALLGFGEALGAGSFDAKTREAISLAVAGANGCDYCASAHSAISKGLNVNDAAIEAHLAGRSDDPRLAAILRLADGIVAHKGHVSDSSLDAARQAGLNDGDIVEVTANVIVNIFTNYLNHVAQTDIDFPVRRAQAA